MNAPRETLATLDTSLDLDIPTTSDVNISNVDISNANISNADMSNLTSTHTENISYTSESADTAVALSYELPERTDDVVHLKSKMSVDVYHRRSAHKNDIIDDDFIHPLKHLEDFPGPMCLQHLTHAHVLTQLDESTFFPSRFAQTCELRAHVVREIIPYGSVASGQLAAWIWLGGEFPQRIDIARENHYHSILFGRNVRSTSRQIHRRDLREFPQLLVTTPERTACDLACADDLRAHPYAVADTIYRLIEEYHFSERDCMEIMRQNTRKPHYTAGLNLLLRIFAEIKIAVETARCTEECMEECTEKCTQENEDAARAQNLEHAESANSSAGSHRPSSHGKPENCGEENSTHSLQSLHSAEVNEPIMRKVA